MPQESGRVIQVKADLANDLPAIAGNASGIRDAITNLILNAADAMPEGGKLLIEMRKSEALQSWITAMGKADECPSPNRRRAAA